MSRSAHRHDRFSTLKFFGIALAAIIAAFAVAHRQYFYSRIAETTKQTVDYQNAYIRKVIDGDTIILANYEKVRLIGIDAPERYECDKLFRNASDSGLDPAEIRRMGTVSYEFLRKTCEKQYVRLQFDHERYDRYGRILAFVFLENGTLLNELIVQEGYALAMLRFEFNHNYRKRLIDAQEQARTGNKGLWAERPGLKALLKSL
ncbi:MAG: thermonuclease family protein [Candidatus Auribacterota bacterium]